MSASTRMSFTSGRTSTVHQNWRERFIRPMLVGALVFGLLALILGLSTNQGIVQNAIFIVSYLLLMAVTFLHFPYAARMGVFLLVVYALSLSELLSTGILGDAGFFFLGLMLFATLMFSARAGFISLGVTLLTFLVVGLLVGSGSLRLVHPEAINAPLADWLSTSATLSLFGVAFILGLRQLQTEFIAAQTRSDEALAALQAERASLESRVESRTVQLTAVNEVGRAASSILDPQELAGRVANLITDHFGYYYAALFLVDDVGEQAWLYSATGEAGRVLKENKHHLKIGGNSMVGTAISTGKPRVALDVGTESVRFQNPLLPYTRSEIALPLIIGDRVLGALDVQSTKAGAFGPGEIDTLSAMASQVAIALENARLFQSAQKNLDEMETIQRQYVAEAWRPYAAAANMEYHLGEEDVGADHALEIPLALREQVIGQIKLGAEADWTPDQRNLVETVAAQAALALENARLVEQSQAAARYEYELADITGKIWTATSVEAILQTAVRELGHALDANDVRVELKMDENHE
ncbi:MAG: GAF domain-containing protein [Anaerolineae bacterium]